MRKTLISTIVAGALFTGLVATGPNPVEAAEAGSVDECVTGTPCSVRIGTLTLQSRPGTVVTDEDDGTRRLSGTIDVVTPTGVIPLVDAEVHVRRHAPGHQTLERGVTRVPFPAEWFGEVPVESVPFAEFGHQHGAELHHLGAHLRDEREYFYFHFQTDLELGLPWPDEPWAGGMPQTIAFDAGYSATVVLDPTDPYLYVGAPCFSFPESGGDDDASKPDGDATETSTRDGDHTEPEQPSEPAAHDRNDPQEPSAPEEDADADGTAITIGIEDDDVGRNLDGQDPGEDCGLGFSWNGLIPSPSLGRPMSGHVVVDVPMPVGPFVEIDGTVVVALGDAARMVGFGDVEAAVPMLSDVVDVAMPLGDALVDTEFSGQRIGYSIDGLLESDGTYEIGFNDLPIALPGNGSVRVASSFGVSPDAAGVWSTDPDSYFRATGNIGVGPRAFGELAGIDLADVATADAALHIDRTGIALGGAMNGQLHPSLHTSAGSSLELFVGFERPEASYLSVRGGMEVAGTDLAGASLDIDRAGARVAGTMDTGITRIAMSGSISATGVDLRGSADLDLPTAEIGKAAGEVVATADSAQAEVARIRSNMDHVRDEIIEARRATSENLRLAQVGVERAEREVASIQSSINTNNAKIKYLKRRISGEKRWYRRQSWWRKMRYVGRHVGRLSAWNAAIGGLHTANAGLYAGRAVANGALGVARDTLRETDAALRSIPVDSDPRMILLNAALATAEIAASAATTVAEPFRDLVGDLRAGAAFRIGSDGVFGEIRAEWCTDRCVTLSGVSLQRADDGWRGCVAIDPTAPHVCAWI